MLREVEDASIAVQKTGEQRIVQEQQVTALQFALNFADQRYHGGKVRYLAALTGRRSLFNAEGACKNQADSIGVGRSALQGAGRRVVRGRSSGRPSS